MIFENVKKQMLTFYFVQKIRNDITPDIFMTNIY